jgi:formylglycine-generating enzyme required for sulfatase activity
LRNRNNWYLGLTNITAVMKKVFGLFISLLLACQVFAGNPDNDLMLRIRSFQPAQYQMALDDLAKRFPDRFEVDESTNVALRKIKQQQENLLERMKIGDRQAFNESLALLRQLDDQLLKNPLLSGKSIISIKRSLGVNARSAMGRELGLAPSNFQNNSEIHNPAKDWKNEFVQISFQNGKRNIKTFYKPPTGTIISDPEMHFSGTKMLFSSIGTNGRWHIFEIELGTRKVRQITPEAYKDFDSFDACYTPDNRIVFCSTATFLGLPCTDGGNKMSGLFLFDPKTGRTRQLTFDQDSNWGPVVMNNGTILYQRWEYADLPHSNSRFLFTMNPDGTTQQSYYGSNSYFPAAFFNARPIPGHPTAVVGIAGGHHSVSRSGRMLIIDPTVGRFEAEGVTAEIPHYGKKVIPLERDRLPDGVWPHFLHPMPLSSNYFIVSMKATPNSLWGLYLADIFGNLTLISESESYAFIEPVLTGSVSTPPVIPDRVNLNSTSATVFMQDVYEGGGLKGIPKGEVKRLRIISYGFSPLQQGGLLGTIGMDGPWDIKRILGTVDVEPDGSAMFVIPANTPVAVQPLDSEGKALQIMRSWFTAMPGENLSCIGCHEDKNRVPPPRPSMAARKKPQPIQPWYGKERGFSFAHEIQPILDRACVSCHNESRTSLMSLHGDKKITNWSSQIAGRADISYGGNFSVSYANLHRYVRRPGIESDMNMLVPMDVHADQTELMQILNKGHHNVQLLPEEIEKLACWIDMNAPFHGRRSDISTFPRTEEGRRLRKIYAEMFNIIEPDLEELPEIPMGIVPRIWEKQAIDKGVDSIHGWPVQRNIIENKQLALGQYQESISLAEGVSIDIVKIPEGSFIMGSTAHPDEMPRTHQKVEAFWIGRTEITNKMYALFDPEHDSRVEHRHGYQFGRKGYPLNHPDQPVVRVSWMEAMAFCNWLSEKTGKKVSLPTEAQWEWACRAGSDTPYSFGQIGGDFSFFANLGDIRLSEFAACTAHKNYESTKIIDQPGPYDDWIPRDTLFNDGGFVSESVGRYRANYFDLNDMHGNVWEWTRSSYKPYPYSEDDGRNDFVRNEKRVARGGSWYDRPYRATSSFRLPYRDYQKVFNVGFRIVIEE